MRALPLSFSIILLTLTSTLASARPARGPVPQRPPRQSPRPPPRALVQDPRWDRHASPGWVERAAPDPQVTSATSSASSSAIVASASSSERASIHSEAAQLIGGSTPVGSSTSAFMSLSSVSAIPTSTAISTGVSASASSSGSQNTTSLLGSNGWHFPYMTLWNGTAPNLEDVRQVVIANCWMPAASIAVVYNSPEWISNLFTHTDGTPMVGQSYPTESEVLVQLWNPANGWRYQFPVNIYNESTTEDYPGGNWWHSALSQAFQGMGQMTDILGINSDGSWHQRVGAPNYAIAMLTGRYTDYYYIRSDIPTPGALFAACANATFTPIVIASNPSVGNTSPQIIGNHDYAVMSVTDKGQSGQFVNVRNPWGSYESFNVQDLFANCYFLYMMADQSPLVWQG